MAELSLAQERIYAQSLRPFFHPIAALDELKQLGRDEHGMQRVLAKELLGDRIVIADLEGQVVAMSGTCPHRGSALALGWVNREGTGVACRYHGFEWGPTGRICRIPALEAAGLPLPGGKNWRNDAYPTLVKYGLIWVCLEPEAKIPIMPVPESDDPSFIALPIAERVWEAGLGRTVEGSLDTYHFAFTHRGTIGDPTRPEAPKARVSLDGPFFYLEYDIHQPKNPTVTYDADAIAGSDRPGFVTSHYQFWAAPNAIRMRKTSGKVRFSVLVAMCPESGRRTRLYRILYPGRDWAVDHEEFQRTQDLVQAEDREVVESARPWELRVDLDAELHAVMDRPTVAYRRWLASMGIEFL